LRLLNQTPITAVGINFGYKIILFPDELQTKLPILLGQELASEQIAIKYREFRWSSQYEEGLINFSAKIKGEEAEILFNFHLENADTNSAIKYIEKRFINRRDKTKGILTNVFNTNLD
jgi:hypothetical protein